MPDEKNIPVPKSSEEKAADEGKVEKKVADKTVPDKGEDFSGGWTWKKRGQTD